MLLSLFPGSVCNRFTFLQSPETGKNPIHWKIFSELKIWQVQHFMQAVEIFRIRKTDIRDCNSQKWMAMMKPSIQILNENLTGLESENLTK